MEKITSKTEKKEIMEILKTPTAGFNHRVYLVTFLFSVAGYSADEIKDIIDKNRKWNKYDKNQTAYHVDRLCEKL